MIPSYNYHIHNNIVYDENYITKDQTIRLHFITLCPYFWIVIYIFNNTQ